MSYDIIEIIVKSFSIIIEFFLVGPIYFLSQLRNIKSSILRSIYLLLIFIIFILSIYILFQYNSLPQIIDMNIIYIWILLGCVLIFICYLYPICHVPLIRLVLKVHQSKNLRQKFFIELALCNVNSSNLEKKIYALKQLEELAIHEEAYRGFIDFIQRTKGEEYIDLYLRYLCKMRIRRGQVFNSEDQLV